MPPSLNQGRIMVSQLMMMSAMNRPMRPNTAPLTPTTRRQADSKMLLLKFAAKPARKSAVFGRVVSTSQSGAALAGNRLYEQQEACLAKHMCPTLQSARIVVQTRGKRDNAGPLRSTRQGQLRSFN